MNSTFTRAEVISYLNELVQDEFPVSLNLPFEQHSNQDLIEEMEYQLDRLISIKEFDYDD